MLGYTCRQAGAQHHVRVPSLKGDRQQAGIFPGRTEQQRCPKVILKGHSVSPSRASVSFLRSLLWVLRKQGEQFRALPTSPLPQWPVGGQPPSADAFPSSKSSGLKRLLKAAWWEFVKSGLCQCLRPAPLRFVLPSDVLLGLEEADESSCLALSFWG